MFKKMFMIIALVIGVPTFVFAQTTIDSVLGTTGSLLNTILKLLFTVALIVFVWGVIKFVISANADDKEKARGVVVKGIIGLFVIVSVWGIVGVIQNTFGVGTVQLEDRHIPQAQNNINLIAE